ncbi:MAG TPA: vWA domain-containing protein [Kofleriaceae bacterium]
MRDRSIAIMVAAFACACGPSMTHGDDTGAQPDAGGGSGSGGGGDGGPEAHMCTEMDLLFVIDNSGSMGEEQTNLISNFPAFITVLDASGLNYRVAVTTTARNYSYNMVTPLGNIPASTSGESGEMLKKGAMTKRWLDKGDPNIAMTFSTLANVGTGGSGDEMPLGAMRDAFEDRMTDGTNMGFRRPNALLGVVMLTDENDCSYEQSVNLPLGQSLCSSMMEPPQNYKTFLDTYAGNPTRWAAAIIAGPGPGACSSAFGNADEATRLIQFQQSVGNNAIISSICDGNLSTSLMQATMLFQSACGGIIL